VSALFGSHFLQSHLLQVDVLAWRSKTSRVHAQIKDFCAILSGLVVAQDYKRGQQLVADKDFDENADFFQVSLQELLWQSSSSRSSGNAGSCVAGSVFWHRAC
jgi:hypothetical protein